MYVCVGDQGACIPAIHTAELACHPGWPYLRGLSVIWLHFARQHGLHHPVALTECYIIVLLWFGGSTKEMSLIKWWSSSIVENGKRQSHSSSETHTYISKHQCHWQVNATMCDHLLICNILLGNLGPSFCYWLAGIILLLKIAVDKAVETAVSSISIMFPIAMLKQFKKGSKNRTSSPRWCPSNSPKDPPPTSQHQRTTQEVLRAYHK